MPHKYIRLAEAYAVIHMDLGMDVVKKDELCQALERRGITADDVVKDEYEREDRNGQ